MRFIEKIMVPSFLMLAAFAPPQEDAGVQVGAKVDYTFRTPPVNSLGVAGLSDLLGKPVLLDFWGHR